MLGVLSVEVYYRKSVLQSMGVDKGMQEGFSTHSNRNGYMYT